MGSALLGQLQDVIPVDQHDLVGLSQCVIGHDRSNGVGDGVRPFQQHVTVLDRNVHEREDHIAGNLPRDLFMEIERRDAFKLDEALFDETFDLYSRERQAPRGESTRHQAPTPRVLRRIHE